jgi:cyclophilin family peptidyl-prolyl cis-trans isomerase
MADDSTRVHDNSCIRFSFVSVSTSVLIIVSSFSIFKVLIELEVNKMIRLLLLISFVALISCKQSPASLNRFSDIVLLRIADLQDRRLPDSLLAYLKNANADYRKEAVEAYASLQDSNYVHALGRLLLTDSDSAVRRTAAFALGQTACIESEELLWQSSQKEETKTVLAETIEAYGKVSKSWRLKVSSDDSIITNALSWSYYRMAIRDQGNEVMNSKAAELLKPLYAKSARLGAAHYFSRGAKDFERHLDALILAASDDSSPDVRMAATLALKKITTPSSRIAAEKILRHDPDYRVRINASRVLQMFPFHLTKKCLEESLADSTAQVGTAASEAIKASITPDFAKDINGLARRATDWRIQANLYEAALSVSNDKELANEIIELYKTSSNDYQKAGLLLALQHSVMSYQFVADQLIQSGVPVIKSAAALALTSMNYKKNFEPSLRNKFAELYKAAIDGGDAAVIGTVAGALADSSLNYKSVITDYSFLQTALDKLSLPKDFETIIPLEIAIAYFEKSEPAPRTNEFNHPVQWALVKQIPRDQRAVIKTTRGDVVITLFVEEAPGSVANFITLASKNYYNGKYFHRVAPNFVVQAGCPRGDGWGSEDYSLRSEFSTRRYTTGSVGMASAGKDTEGTQWFITHSPTPHLDGRYTLFAEVERGMDVVDLIGVGDQIISIQLVGLELPQVQPAR